MISEHFSVGRIEDIQLGDRGEGGRLKWVRIHGSEGTETVHKELPIRRLFGGLPSALFDLDIRPDSDGRTFVFLGAGRGHGVGMCQNGARGMARAGYGYRDILTHYFTGATVAGSN
jgi:SpoIID/LytB domain protein